ncbi:MAG TPA: hypothetical protein VF522_23650 [Ramlibacter sp.]|uniref:hypothetical protein n=1 Tax=Ramlibacter sp. TaxID=1917967 RepID=UPI002ED18138
MNTSARSFRLVSGLAVAAVSIASLGAVATTWVARSMGEAPDDAAALVDVRPAADAAVHVVKAPADLGMPVLGTRECAGWRATSGSDL